MSDVLRKPAPAFTGEECDFFRENGYVVVRDLIDDATREAMIARTRHDLVHHIEPIEYEADLSYPGAPTSLDSEGGRTARRLKTAYERDPLFLEVLRRPEVLGRLHQLLGAGVVMPTAHHNCVMTKQPRFSSDTGWHQDIRYWRFQQPELVTLWIALGMETPENGCLKVIPGSHKTLYDRRRLDDDLFLRTDLPENQALIDAAQYVALDPGDVLFFHCLTFHAASRNFTDQPKFSVVFTFRGADNAPLPGTRSASSSEISLEAMP